MSLTRHTATVHFSRNMPGRRSSPRTRLPSIKQQQKNVGLLSSRGRHSVPEEIAPSRHPGSLRLTSSRSIYEALGSYTEDGLRPTRMVRGSWLLKRAMALRQAKAQHGPNSKAVRRLALPRRQDMPEEAFIGPGELKMHEPPGYIGKQWRVAVFACSYCWRTKAHPDPYGETLLMLADALAGMLEKRLRQMTEWATMPKTEFSVLWAYEHFPKEFGVFIDWCSVFQPDKATGEREPAEQVAYDIALNDLELWYAHQLTTVFLLTLSAPPTRADYYHSGWTTYESIVARILKKRRGDLWDPIIDVGEPNSTRHLQPPIHVDEFRDLVRVLVFTNGADRGIVFKLYIRTLRHTLQCASALHYEGCGWQPPEMKQLAKVLPMCVHLRTLKLSNNSLGQEGFNVLARTVGLQQCLPNLRVLDLGGNDLSGNPHALQGLAEAVSPNPHGLPSIADAGAEPRPHPPGLIMLQELHLQECKLGPVGFVNFCRSLRRGALHALLKLGIEGNHIEDAAVEPLTVALANNGAMPKLKFVLGLPARGGITAVETLFKVMGHRRGSWEMMNELKAEIKRPVEW